MKLVKQYGQDYITFQQDSEDGYVCDICKKTITNVPLLFIDLPCNKKSICMGCNLKMIRDFNNEFSEKEQNKDADDKQ